MLQPQNIIIQKRKKGVAREVSDKPFPGSVIESSEYDKESGGMKQKIRVVFLFLWDTKINYI